METRTTSRTVTFRHPFFLTGMDAKQPAGRYVVETEEAPLDLNLSVGYQRVATWIWLQSELESRGVSRVMSIDPGELAAALRVDGQQAAVPA